MPATQNTYGASTALTKTLASLASDTNLLIGRSIAAIDNTGATKYNDYSIEFSIRTGTSPTASRQIEIWAAPSEDGTTYAGGNGGTDAAKTHTAESKSCMVPLWIMPTNATSNTDYIVVIPSLAAVLGAMPRKCSFFIVHNTGVALNATEGNHVITASGLQYSS